MVFGLNGLNGINGNNAKNVLNKIDNNYSDFNYITKFKKQSLEKRVQASDKITLKYPERVPVIVDCKGLSIDKNKFIVPNDLTMGQFAFVIKKRIKMNPNETIFLLCNNKLINNTNTINNIYAKNKDYDGFLYIFVTLENTFGNI